MPVYTYMYLYLQNNLKGGAQNLNEDTLGSQLKAGIAQYVALEFTKGNGRDNRAISRYMPWLYHPPSAMQQGCVYHSVHLQFKISICHQYHHSTCKFV